MTPRVALIGHAKWLGSPPVDALRQDRQLLIVGRSAPTSRMARHAITRADVALIALGAAQAHALSLLRRMAEESRCIAVAPRAAEDVLAMCVDAGAWGHLLETATPREYRAAVSAAVAGRLAYPENVLDRIVTRAGRMGLRS